MASNTGNPFSQCLCCVECQDNAKDFQKIVDLKNIGLVIYRHLVEIRDKDKGTDDATKVTEEIFIIENTKDQEITSAQYLPEIEQNKISCPRCRKIFEHAQRLLHTIPNIDKNIVRGICDHCLMEQKSCYECEQIIHKFLSKAKELPENTKHLIKQWLSKAKHVFKNIDIDDNFKDFELEKSRTRSDLYVDRLLMKSPIQRREPHVKRLFIPKTTVTKGQIDDQIVSLEEGQETARAQFKHLKEKRIRILESIPPVPIPSKEKLSEGSFEHIKPSTRPKSGYSKMKPDDMDLLFGSAYKTKRERLSLRKYHSDESLLTIAEVTSKTDAEVRKDFSYFFPKKKKYVYPKRFASSSELIKETQDILQAKAEAERKKREAKVLRKLNIQAKKRKARAERKAYPGAKPKDKAKFSKEPHSMEDVSFRHLTTPMGREQKWGPAAMREERELSSATIGGVYKRDDKSHKIYDESEKTKKKGLSPSKTADFDIDKGDTMHMIKGKSHAKGDISKGIEPKVGKDSKVTHEGKTAPAKTGLQKDIKEERKRKEKTDNEKPKKEYEEKRQREKYDKEGQVRPAKDQKQREKAEREKHGKGKVDERTLKEQRHKDKEERDKSGKGKVDERTSKEQKQKDKEEKDKSGKGKIDERTSKEQRQKDKEEKDKSGKGKVDERTPKDQKQKEREEREKSGKGKGDESLSKEQKGKEDKVKSPGQRKEVEQKTKDKKGEEKQMKPDKIQKEKKEFVDKSTETPAKEKKQKDEKGDSKKDKEQQLKQGKDKEEKEKTTKEEEEELRQETEKIQRDAREGKEIISSKAQEALLGLGGEKQQKGKEQKEKVQKEKDAAEPTKKQKDEKLQRNREQKDIKEKTTEGEEEIHQETQKIERDAREAKDIISAKAHEALFGLGKEKQQKETDTKHEKDKKEKGEGKSGSGKTAGNKTASGKSKKSKREKSPKKKITGEEETKKSQSEDDIAPKGKHVRKFNQPDEPEAKELAVNKIHVRRGTPDDTILRLVRLKQLKISGKKAALVELKALNKKLRRTHKPHKILNKKCLMCIESDLEFDLDSLLYEKKTPKFEEIIVGSKIYKYTPPYFDMTMVEEPSGVPQTLLFKSKFVQEDKIELIAAPKAPVPVVAEGGGDKSPPKKKEKQAKVSASTDVEASKGVIHYSLSDRSFIEKGWTMLPTEKIVRKMNVYRMRPAHPEFDWFEHNKKRGQMTYDTGEILAEFDDNGRGRWFYRNGRLALDYYDAEELNANQRFVIWSSGEPDERGRAQPYTILATFDYLGNGIVFDHSGKIRLKYNQTEGIVLDRKIGPVSHWKWHTLNDPPVLQQVMMDTHMAHKDQNIMKLGGAGDDKSQRPDNEEMLTIEFENFIKEKSRKLTQSFKPFQIKMKALKINENFSLRVMDQASVYLIYRDGTTNLKLNIGMILDHKEIVDTDTADVGEVSNNVERLPPKTDSLEALQKSIAYAQGIERARSARARRLRLPPAVASADKMTAAASRPLRPPLRTIPSDSSASVTRTSHYFSRKPTRTNIYYDNRLF